MATITSVQSGNWSDESTWDSGIPGLDYVIITSGHVVTFDMESAEIKQLKLSENSVLEASTEPGNYKLTLNEDPPFMPRLDYYSCIYALRPGAEIRAGSEEECYPSGCTFRIHINHSDRYINCGDLQNTDGVNYLTLKLYCYDPPTKYVRLLSTPDYYSSIRQITNITNADPGVVTCPNHGFVGCAGEGKYATEGELVCIAGLTGMEELNNLAVKVHTVIDEDTFTLGSSEIKYTNNTGIYNAPPN